MSNLNRCMIRRQALGEGERTAEARNSRCSLVSGLRFFGEELGSVEVAATAPDGAVVESARAC